MVFPDCNRAKNVFIDLLKIDLTSKKFINKKIIL